MTRLFKVLACVLFMAVALWGCAGGVYDESTAATETTETTRPPPEIRHPAEILDEGANWAIHWANVGSSFIYIAYDHEGNEILRGEDHRGPSFTMLNENLLKFQVRTGTDGARRIQFIDLVLGAYSPNYHDWSLDSYGHGMILRNEWLQDEQRGQWVAHDIFNPQLNRTELEFDFWQGGIFDVPQEVFEQFRGMTFFRAVEWLSPTQLNVEYFHDSGEFVSRTITLD